MTYVIRTKWNYLETRDEATAIHWASTLRSLLQSQVKKGVISDSDSWVRIEDWAGKNPNTMFVRSRPV